MASASETRDGSGSVERGDGGGGDRPYVLGVDEIEVQRLGIQHRLWSDAAMGLWKRGGIAPGQSVLDLGCGPGHAAFDLAQIVGPEGRVIGLDEAAGFVEVFNAQAGVRGYPQCRGVVGKAHEARAVLERAGELIAFDAVYTRWVLGFVPNPEACVEEVGRMLRPGARFLIQDYFNYASMTMAPRRHEHNKVVDAIVAEIVERGGDPDIMGRLPGVLLRHGFRLDHIGHLQRMARPTDSLWAWPTTFWESVIPRMVQAGRLTDAEGAEFMAVWGEASRDPASFIQCPTVYEIMATKV